MKKRTPEQQRKWLFHGWSFEDFRSPREIELLIHYFETGEVDENMRGSDKQRIGRCVKNESI